MGNLLNSTVMNALMSAASSAKMNQFCTGLAARAEREGDDAAAQRAMSYANDFRDKAMTAKEQTQEAVEEQAELVRQENQLAQQQRLEALAAENLSEAGSLAEAGAAAAGGVTQPAAVLELSQEYLSSVQTGAATESGPDPARHAAKPVSTEKFPAPEFAAYLSNKPASAPGAKAAIAGAAGFRRLSMDIRV